MTNPKSETMPVAKERAPNKPASSHRSTGQTFLAVMMVAVLFVCGAVFFLVENYIDKIEALQQQPSVVVIDVGAIQLAKKQELQQQLASYDAVMREVDVFAKDLQDLLNAYRDAGIVVINKNATISTPLSLDVTKLVADRLQVRLPEAFH